LRNIYTINKNSFHKESRIAIERAQVDKSLSREAFKTIKLRKRLPATMSIYIAN